MKYILNILQCRSKEENPRWDATAVATSVGTHSNPILSEGRAMQGRAKIKHKMPTVLKNIFALVRVTLLLHTAEFVKHRHGVMGYF